MTTNSPEQVSATIYQFPLRGRYAPRNPGNGSQAPSVEIMETSGWYHTDAVKAESARPH